MLDPLDHYRYLTTARRRVLDRVRTLTHDQYVQEFGFGLKTVRRTLQHMAGAEWFVLGQLRPEPLGEPPFSSPRVPDQAALETAWRALEPRTIGIIEREDDWDRPVEIRVIMPSRQAYRVRATPRIVFAQFCYHEVHHRAQVMAMLRLLGASVETIDFLLVAGQVVETTAT